jgi:SAM-dependent MidA family methyltransferase
VNLAALDWIASAGAAIGRGLLLVLDYGYPADVLFAPSRRWGTLLCYYRHTLNSDPLDRIGEQDITSHVDFTSLRRAAEGAGMVTQGLVSQRRLLHNLGWPRLRDELAHARLGSTERAANLRALDALVDPDGLGRLLALFLQRELDGFSPLGLVGGVPAGPDGLVLRTAEHRWLPDPAEADGLPDPAAQWAEIWAGAPDQ